MISCDRLFSLFEKTNLKFFVGVPDSCFAPLVNYLLLTDKFKHIIATNEGEALAIAAGYHLSTGEIPVLYLQNDGLCNMMNPITSLTDENVYEIPFLMLISWRGAPGMKDAPQHQRIGKILVDLLNLLKIQYFVYDGNNEKLESEMEKIVTKIKKGKKPFAILFRKGDIENYPIKFEDQAELKREEAIRIIVDNFENDIFIATTGKISRELFEYREERKKSHKNDFLNVGAMGYTNAIGFGIALNTNKKIFVLDGDGALLMHMGNLATIGYYQPKNFYHIILNNFSHDSTGGQPTVANKTDFCGVAKAVGYKYTATVKNKEELQRELDHIRNLEGPVMLVVNVKRGARKNLGRPTIPLKELKKDFMKNLIG